MHTLATLYFYFPGTCYLILFDFLKHYLFLNAIRRLRHWQRKFLMLEKNSQWHIRPRQNLSSGDTMHLHIWHEWLVHTPCYVMRPCLLLYGSRKGLCTSHPSNQTKTIYCAPTMHKTFRWRSWQENWKSDGVWWKLPASLEQMWFKAWKISWIKAPGLLAQLICLFFIWAKSKGLGPNGEWLS